MLVGLASPYVWFNVVSAVTPKPVFVGQPETRFHSPVFSGDGRTVYYLESTTRERQMRDGTMGRRCKVEEERVRLSSIRTDGETSEILMEWPSSPRVGILAESEYCGPPVQGGLRWDGSQLRYQISAGEAWAHGYWTRGIGPGSWAQWSKEASFEREVSDRIHGRREVTALCVDRSCALVLYDDEKLTASTVARNSSSVFSRIGHPRGGLVYLAREGSRLVWGRFGFPTDTRPVICAIEVSDLRARQAVAADLVEESLETRPAGAVAQALANPGRLVDGYFFGKWAFVKSGSQYYELGAPFPATPLPALE